MRLLVIRHAEQEFPRAPAFENPPHIEAGSRLRERDLAAPADSLGVQ